MTKFTDFEALTMIGFSEACVSKNKALRVKLKQINGDIRVLVNELNGIHKLMEPQRKQGHRVMLQKLSEAAVERLNDLRYDKAHIKTQLRDNTDVITFVKKAFKLEDAQKVIN